MMRRLFKALALVSACLAVGALAANAAAQTAPADSKNSNTKWSPATELVVRAPWPPMWRLTKGDSTVWVMVTLRRVPEDFGWDSTRVRKLLKGAKVLIVPQGGGGSSPSNTNLARGDIKAVLTPQTYQRLQDTVAREGMPFELYSRYKPAWAGYFLAINVHHQRNFKGQYYPDVIPVLAQAENVRIKRVDIRVKSNYFDHLNALDEAGSEACLNTYLDGIDFNVANVPKMAEAWGKSDMPALLGYYGAYPKDNCVAPNDQTVEDRRNMTVNRLVGAIDEALSSPGRSVALVPLDWLLIEDGVLDRLKDKGVEIKAPAE